MNDLISRRAAITAIDDLPNCYNGYSDTYDKAYIIGVLEELPRVDVPDRKVGKWKDKQMHDETIEPINAWKHKCSVCGFYVVTIEKKSEWHYCPNCGAKMEDIQDSTETS